MSVATQSAAAKRYVHVERPKLGLELSYEFEEEKRTGPNINTEDIDHEFREQLDIQTDGWVYHPGLLVYRLGFQPEWAQRIEERETGESGNKDVYLPGYLIDTTFLQYKPYTLHLFGRRYNYATRSAFAASSETETDDYGANLMLKYRVLPTTLTYSHLNSEQTGFFQSEEDSDDFRLRMSHQARNNDTSLDATYNDRIRTTGTFTTRTKSSYSTLQNSTNITGDRRVMLNALLSHRWTESNLLETSGIRLSENLFWKHRENLRSNYRLNYDNEKFGEFERETMSLGAGLTHLLYENLTTTLAADASETNFTDGNEDKFGGRLHFDYRRAIPWGTLNASMGYDYEGTNRRFTAKFIQVTDEAHILQTGDVTLLENENVDIGSIRVTDTTGTVIFVKNIDYRIQEVDSFVRISRTTFGSITDGQQVLVSYGYLSNPAFDDTIFGQSYGIGFQLWSALLLNYRYHRSKQSIRSGTPPDRPIDDRTHTAELRLDWRWTETRFLYEDADTTSGISTTRWLAQEAITLRPLREVFFRFSGHYGDTRFKDRGETEDFYGLRSDIDWVPASWWKLGLEGFWDRVSGVTEKTVDKGASAELEMSYRIWSAKLTYRFIEEEDEFFGEKRTNHYVLLKIIRTLW